MLDKLLSVVATNAKLVVAGAVGAALVAGGGAVAIQQVSDSTPSSVTTELGTGDEHRSDTATAKIATKPPKPPKTDDGDTDGGAKDNHGACVSAAAHAAVQAGSDSNAHGKAVSLVAKSDCGKTSHDAKADSDSEVTEQENEADDEVAEPQENETETDGDAGSHRQSSKSGPRGKH